MGFDADNWTVRARIRDISHGAIPSGYDVVLSKSSFSSLVYVLEALLARTEYLKSELERLERQ